MHIRPFDKQKDLKYLENWASDRKLHNLGLPVSPQNGFIAFSNDTPVACGFFIQMEGDYLLADGFITNPHASSATRNEALDRLFNKMIKVAKHYKQKGILTLSEDHNTIMRSMRHGFSSLPHQAMRLGL